MINKHSIITGKPVFIEELDIYIHQPTIEEILSQTKSEDDFFLILNAFSIDKNALRNKQDLQEFSNFQICSMIIYSNAEQNEERLISFFSLILPDYDIINFNVNGLMFLKKDKSKTLIITEMNFEILKDALRQIFRVKDPGQDGGFNPKGKKAEQIAQQLMEARARRAKKSGEVPPTIEDYMIILSVGSQVYTLDKILKLTIYQFQLLIERFMLKNNFNMDFEFRMAGGRSDEDPVNWMKHIE